MKKRIVSFLLAAAMCTTLVSPALAASSLSTEEELTLIASDMIEVTHFVTESGAMQTTYSNLDAFIAYAQENCDVSDYDLARFVMDYTEQYYSENMSESTVLETLTYLETTVNHEIIANLEETLNAQEQGVMPADEWISNDGHMKITTTASRQNVNLQTRYVIKATATWLVTPSVYDRDVFVLTSTAAFDETYVEEAYFEHNEYCTTHNHALSQFYYVDGENRVDNDTNGTTEILYESGYPGIAFDTMIYCDQSDVYSVDPDQTEITAHIQYRVIPAEGEPANAQASYSHKTFGLGDISWSLGADGLTPSFSIVGTTDDYFARPITLL